MIKKVYWWVRVVLLSLRWIPRFNLGDKVWYKGQQWILCQGVCAPSWNLFRTTTTLDGERMDHFADYVDESEFRKTRDVSNYLGSFKSGYKFYISSWFDIWCREGIQPWMLGCNIWAR